MKKLYFLFLSLFFLVGCKENKPEYFTLTFHLFQPLPDVEIKGELPSAILDIMNYYEINNEDDEKCDGKVYAANKIIFKREDLNKKEEFGIPLKATGKLGYKTNTLANKQLKENYKPSLIKVSKLLIKEGKATKMNIPKNAIIIKLNDNKNNIVSARKKIEKLLCEGKKSINVFVIIEKEETVTEGDEDGGNSTTEGSEGEEGSDEGGSGTGIIKTNTYEYSGEKKDNQPHGTGTMVFLKDGFAPVPKHSPKQIPVKKGQKLTGRFLHGKFVAGSLLDEHGNKIKSIYIGR